MRKRHYQRNKMRSARFKVRQQRKLEQPLCLAGIASMVSIVVLGYVLITPSLTMSSKALATCADGSTTEGCVSSKASMDTEVNVGTSISIAMDNKVVMDITPTSTGAASTVSSKVQVATNSIDGYALFMQGDKALVNTSTTNDDSIVNSISNATSTTTLANMANNTYGYNLSDSKLDESALQNATYAPLDTTGTTPIKKTTSTSIGTSNTDYGYGDEYYLNLGVKVGTNLPAGTYTGTVTISAVANPVTVRSMAGLKYMQDMTSSICENTIEHYTKRLTDTRDGKEYWVAKLADGNCWMTQNLALDITEAMASATGNNGLLNSTTTDIGYNANGELIDGIKYWNADSEYPPRKTDIEAYTSIQQVSTITTSWGGWKYDLLATPSAQIGCATESTDAYNTAKLGLSLSESCNMSGFINISSAEWTPAYSAQVGTFKLPTTQSAEDFRTYNGLVAADVNNKTYDAHYLVGNYYAYNTSTAGTGGVLDNANAPDSICPKGWQLPKAGNNLDIPGTLNSDSGTWAYLRQSYSNQAGSNPPVSFVLGGDLRSEYGVEIATTGRYWSGTSGPSTAYHALINPILLDGSRLALAKNGNLSVRCLAR